MLHLWNHKDYYEWAERISLKYAKLVAFVGDGLPAAVKGIADFSAVGLCNETFGAVLIFSPCYNHILNNSFIDSINNSAEILKVVNDARKLVVLINKQKVKEQKIKVPRAVFTPHSGFFPHKCHFSAEFYPHARANLARARSKKHVTVIFSFNNNKLVIEREW